MKLLYLSDIHLEFKKNFSKLKNEDYSNTTLALLGDIGYPDSLLYKNFIKHCSETFKNVIVITGNHEYYDIHNKHKKSMDEINDLISNYIKNFSNVYFLNNSVLYMNTDKNTVIDYHEIEDKTSVIKIIGTTLWSDIDVKVSNSMNDYRFIFKKNNEKHIKITPEETKVLFNRSKTFLLNELKNSDEIRCVLLTHHGVNKDLCNGEEYKNSKLASAFATDIPELNSYKNLIACINGHTHVNIDTFIPDTSIKLLSNCMGYIGERLKCDLNKFIEL